MEETGHIAANMRHVQEVIAAACAKSGRNSSDVKLIAVSKTKPVCDMMEAYAAGCRDFGENYVQEILEKEGQLPKDARIHMIGHLQTNKAGKIIEQVAMIHAVDTIHLAESLEKQAVKHSRAEVPILLEVNVAEEESKFGFQLSEVDAAVRTVRENCPHLKLEGLMTSAPYTEKPEENRIYFRKLREAAEKNHLHALSMGMTNDYAVAVEEGATMVRVGTAIFGARDYGAKQQ